jgi:hypothetical protein
VREPRALTSDDSVNHLCAMEFSCGALIQPVNVDGCACVCRLLPHNEAVYCRPVGSQCGRTLFSRLVTIVYCMSECVGYVSWLKLCSLAGLQKQEKKKFLESRARPVRRADNLTATCELIA